ncbi:unnamed protein product [Sympodiomycopsis kandeliae]
MSKPQFLDQLMPSSSSLPWQKVTDRLSCITDDPKCRANVLIHAAILLLIIILAASRKILQAISKEDAKARSLSNGNDDKVSWPQKFSHAEVDSIMVYPIKSCQGSKLPQTFVGRKGIELDRRWIVVKKAKDGKWEKVILKDEPKMVLVQVKIDEEANTLQISASHLAQKPQLKPFSIPIQVSSSWELLKKIEMYGDAADGRIVQVDPNTKSEWNGTPSDWISELLGYECLLIQYEPNGTQRAAYPLYRGSSLPADSSELKELKKPRGIEWADEYPLLVATTSSLAALQSQIRDAVMANDDTDGRGGKAIGGKLFQKEFWREKILAEEASKLQHSLPSNSSSSHEDLAEWLSMLRFRPNIILKSCTDTTIGKPLTAWEEDNWTKLTPLSGNNPLEIHISTRCERCLMTTTDPFTSERKDLSVPLAFLRKSNFLPKRLPLDPNTNMPISNQDDPNSKKGPCFGVYAVIPEKAQGELTIGDVLQCTWRKGS